MNVSAVICTHNPRQDYLQRVVDALKRQTLPMSRWELLVIDNASKVPVSDWLDLKWHPQARCICENTLGLTPARLRGVKESTADLIIFVDDDNVLAPTYLAESLSISDKFPILGAWNGQMHPRFDSKPAEWTREFWPMLALRELDSDRWSNLLEPPLTIPCGAGMCVRRSVAVEYAKRVSEDSRRKSMDRKGKELTGSGDTDLAYTAHDLGLGTGLFKALELTHLIPDFRLEEGYLLRLAEGSRYSETVLAGMRGYRPGPPSSNFLRRTISNLRRRFLMSARKRRFTEATMKGYLKGCAEINSWDANSKPV